MARTRKTYTPEFKLAAVKLIIDQKLSGTEAARRLGVGENLLHAWKKAAPKDGVDAFPSSGHLTPHEEEDRRLRTEVKRVEGFVAGIENFFPAGDGSDGSDQRLLAPPGQSPPAPERERPPVVPQWVLTEATA